MRAGVACIVLRDVGAPVLLLKRAFGEFREKWCFVAGAIESSESPARAAARELLEEIGIDASPTPLLVTSVPTSGIQLHVYVARLSVDPVITLNREHSAYKWATAAEAERLLPLEHQRQALRIAFRTRLE